MSKILVQLVMVVAMGCGCVEAFGAGCAAACQKDDAAETACKKADATKVEPKVDALLGRIEDRASKLKSFGAAMVLRQVQQLQDVEEIRHGGLYYQVAEGRVRFRIHFDSWQDRDLAVDEDEQAKPVYFDEDFVFDGQWLTRRNSRTKMIQRWELSKKPKDSEAFRLGRGPFPLPFAVKKADVLREFDAKLPKRDPNDPAKTDHLVLVPKKTSEYADEYVRLELWISQDNAVPVQMRFEKDDYEVTTVSWSKVKIDKVIGSKTFELAPAGSGWTEEVTPLQEDDAPDSGEQSAEHPSGSDG